MKIRRDDIEEEDDFDTFMKHRKELEKKGLLVTEPSKTEDGNEEEKYCHVFFFGRFLLRLNMFIQ